MQYHVEPIYNFDNRYQDELRDAGKMYSMYIYVYVLINL